MITGPVSQEQLNIWKNTYLQFKDTLSPNKKDSIDVINFLKSRYLTTEVFDREYDDIVSANILENDFYREKLEDGNLPVSRTFLIENSGFGTFLYNNRADIWDDCPILVAIDLNTGYIYVQGSSYLHDEIIAFQGIDEYDLKNYVVTANYIEALKKFDTEAYTVLLKETL